MHIVRQLDSVLQEENKVFSAVAIHQGGEGWNLSTGPEASTTGPENMFSAGPTKQSLYTITSFTWSGATWLRYNEVYYRSASAPEPESGMQPRGARSAAARPLRSATAPCSRAGWTNRGKPEVKRGLSHLGTFATGTSRNLENFNIAACFHEGKDTQLDE